MVNNEKLISDIALSIGFDLVGFSKSNLLVNEIQNLESWLDNNYHAGMIYMEKNKDKRRDVRKILPEAKSVISVGLNYFVDNNYENKAGTGKVSRYAWGEDYHFVMWKKLDELIKKVKEKIPEFVGKSYVDTGPVMDKVWAVKSGLGWMGKNSNIINRKIGSYFFIGNIINNLDLMNSDAVENFCGSCNACIDACPTKAIVKDYVVDANKCISYLTIENKEGIQPSFKGKFENWLFGCDICQEVCPWNIKFSKPTEVNEFRIGLIREISLNSISSMSEEEFRIKYERSPIKRAKLKGLKRNKEFLEKV